MLTLLYTCVVICGLGDADPSEAITILPAKVVLDGPHASQNLLVVTTRGELVTSDLTDSAKLAIADPSIAKLDQNGTILPIADGTTTIVATAVDGRTASAPISVSRVNSPETWSFKRHVIPVLTRAGCNMGSCHGAAAGKNGLRLSLRGYAPETDYNVLSRQVSGRRINKTAPAESLMLLKPTGAIEHGGGVRFTIDSLEYRVLSEWIASGMPRPRDDEPEVARVVAIPSRVLATPGQTQTIMVQAIYTDGRVADVTRWAKFASTDETVAKVDENGHVVVEGTGESAVTVWYSSLVDTSLISVPASTPFDPLVFANASRSGPLDEINLKKLLALGIPPSPPCSDDVFLRRAFLDCTGVLPSEEEVTRFRQDHDADKRSKLVDRLLDRPEFVDYWTYKWSDLLLVSSKSLTPQAMWSFSRSIRKAVAENLPWDEFARRIITARGSTLEDGFANYFVLHRDPIDLTESSSMAFLGMSLTCARCHNHPMEKWTQDQYYGMANLFARVVLRDGRETGDLIVSSSATGDVIHPRKGVAMAPEPLDAGPISTDMRGDRRDAYADWLASPQNPYFDRAIVNRVWRNFFGRGLIEPEDDLRATNPASDEDLLQWLVEDFRSHDRDIKHLIRTIMTSSCYSRSSEPVAGNEHDEKFLSHYKVKRLPAEVLLDAISQVTEIPETFAGYPAGWRSLQLPDAQVASTFLTSFGRPDRVTTCSCERSAEPSIAQALNLTNGDTLNKKLRHERGRVSRLIKSQVSDSEIVRDLFRSALARDPSESESVRFASVLKNASAAQGTTQEQAVREVIEDIFWSVLTSQEFLFNH